MIKAIFTLTFLAAVATSPVAQTVSTAEPPPPPPARAAQTKKWESAAGGFKIAFPSPPTTAVKTFEGSFGPTEIYGFNLPTSFAHYSLSYFDFPTAITDRFDLDTRFDMMRDDQAKRLSARVMHDSEWLFGSHYGRQTTLETLKETVSMRAMVAGPRLFVIIVVTKGRQSALSPAAAAANERRIADFFNSFEVTKLPEAKAEKVKLPADFQVTASPTSFNSAFLGVSLTPPAGWVLSKQEESDFVLEMGKEEIKRKDARLGEYMTNENVRVLAMYTRSELSKSVPGGMFFVFAEQAPYPNFTAVAVAKTYEKLYIDKTEKVVKPITTTRIGGQEFAWLETLDSESKLSHRIYVTNAKGIALEISMMYTDPVDLQPMLKALESIKFTQ